jgi:hypothetical protein
MLTDPLTNRSGSFEEQGGDDTPPAKRSHGDLIERPTVHRAV